MKNILSSILLWIFLFLSIAPSISQTNRTTSKSCGKCGKSVSASSKVGDKCPHCGVVWGRENTQTTNSKYNPLSSTSKDLYSNYTPMNSGSSKYEEEDEVDKSTASKSDTEVWILQKLNENTPKRYYDNAGTIDGFYSTIPISGWYNMNYNYSFDTHNLVISYEEENKKKITKYKVLIPIYDIYRVYEYGGELWITTKKETIIEYNESDNSKRVQSAFNNNFDVYSETDLCKRLHKAFLHLKKFYKKPVSSEPF